MLPEYNRGTTFEVLLSDFTEEEWQLLYPWDSIASDAVQGTRRHPLVVSVDEENRSILLSADTSDWDLRPVRADARIRKNGRNIDLPKSPAIRAVIVAGVTGERQ